MNVLMKIDWKEIFLGHLLEIVWSFNATEADGALILPPSLYQSSVSGYLKLRKTDTEGRKSKHWRTAVELGLTWESSSEPLPQKTVH